MVLIFVMSEFSGDISASQSGSVIEFFVRLFMPDFETLSAAERLEIVSRYQYVVRKGAHFSVYALLGAFSFGFVSSYQNLKRRQSVIIALVFSVLYAASDEWHQTFIPGRAGVFTDVLYDGAGAVTGILIFLLLIFLFKHYGGVNKNEKLSSRQ